MKALFISVSILALVFLSCSSTNTAVNSNESTLPTITGFSPDTVWTFKTLTIYGNHLGFWNESLINIDTAEAYATYALDTIIKVTVPEYAQTGPIRIMTINGTTTSANSVVVEYTFNPHSINDTLPVGAWFSIPGTGMNHSHGVLRLWVGGIIYPIDSIFPDRIVSHVVAGAISGSIIVSDSNGTHQSGNLTVTQPSAWNTLSIIWDNVTITETHTRTGYVNGPSQPFDSTWKTTAVYNVQHDVNVSGIPFERIATGVQYIVPVAGISILWDTISQIAAVYFYPTYSFKTQNHTTDTSWNCEGPSLSAMLPITNDIEFRLPTFSYQITEDSTDTQGLVNWKETTYTTAVSGSFDLVLKKE